MASTGWRRIRQGEALLRTSPFSFVDQVPQPEVQTVRCGNFLLSRQREISLTAFRRSIDDQLELDQLLAQLASTIGSGDSLLFDVWVDLQFGVTIPIPSGGRLISAPAGCTVSVGPDVSMSIVTYHSPAIPEMQRRWEFEQYSVAFQESFDLIFPLGMRADRKFTYLGPSSRPDGFVANRKGFNAAHWVGQDAIASGYVFLTHLARGPYYAGVSAIRNGVVLPSDFVISCQQSGNIPECRRAIDPRGELAMAVLAVHMATISPI